MVASLAQAPLVPALPQQGGSVEPPESFAYLASQVRSLLVAQKEKQKAELAPHLPPNIPPSKMNIPASRNTFIFLSYSDSHG
ncbi:MAG: hypothetical protein IJ257_06140 [Treponema sp.]|nr:hypothetical protein [Treponema sp.]